MATYRTQNPTSKRLIQEYLDDSVNRDVPSPKTRSKRGTGLWTDRPVTRKQHVSAAQDEAKSTDRDMGRMDVAKKAIKHAVGTPAMRGWDTLAQGAGGDDKSYTQMSLRLAKSSANTRAKGARATKQLARIEGLKKARKTDFGQNVGVGRPARPKMYNKGSVRK